MSNFLNSSLPLGNCITRAGRISIIVGLFFILTIMLCSTKLAYSQTEKAPNNVPVTDAFQGDPNTQNIVKPPAFSEVLLKMVPMFAIVFSIFYLLVILPQKKEQEAKVKLLNELKKGDQVVTTGGIIGKVITIADQSITISIEQNGALKIEKEHVLRKYDA